MVLLLFRSISLLSCFLQHAYYVSVSEIYHNPKTQALEISMKIFADDLELALKNNGNPEVIVLEEKPDPALKGMLQKYLDEKFRITIDLKTKQMHVIGYEFDDDALLCYAEILNVSEISSIEVYNAIITEVYEEQINLTHFQFRGKMKSLKTSRSDPSGTIDISSL